MNTKGSSVATASVVRVSFLVKGGVLFRLSCGHDLILDGTGTTDATGLWRETVAGLLDRQVECERCLADGWLREISKRAYEQGKAKAAEVYDSLDDAAEARSYAKAWVQEVRRHMAGKARRAAWCSGAHHGFWAGLIGKPWHNKFSGNGGPGKTEGTT